MNVTVIDKKLERLGVKKRSLSKQGIKPKKVRKPSMEKNVINIRTATPDQEARKAVGGYLAVREAVSFLNEQIPPTTSGEVTEQKKVSRRKKSVDIEEIAEKLNRRNRSTDLDEVADKDEISFVLSQSPKTRSKRRMESASQEIDLDAIETRCSPAKDYQMREQVRDQLNSSSSSEFAMPYAQAPQTIQTIPEPEEDKL